MPVGATGPQYGERAEFGPEDVCVRHADRPSFTLCQRCGRTICPECQNVSAVGVLCPDCVRQAQPSTSARVRRSSRATARRLNDLEFPLVTYSIMAVCGLVFVLQLISANFGDNGVTRALWYAPLYSMPQLFEPWRMLTAMFTHSTGFLLHILFNMLALWLFGRGLEQALGRAAFFALYLFSGLGGSIAVMLWGYADVASLQVATVGASGAIFGLLIATLLAFRASRANITSLAVLIGLNFAIGFLPGAQVSWQAHLGGIIVGAITMSLLLATRGPRRRGARITGLILIGVVLVAVSGLYFVVPPVAVAW